MSGCDIRLVFTETVHCSTKMHTYTSEITFLEQLDNKDKINDNEQINIDIYIYSIDYYIIFQRQ